MKYKWLNQNNNNKLIIFFTGWGMDETSISLNYENYDFLLIYDYNILNNDFLGEIKKYKENYIIGWSMGVLFANYFINQISNIKYKIAINGTVKIIDDNYGISEKIFNNTLNNLNSDNIKKFFTNMGYKDFIIPNRDTENQTEELKNIKNHYDLINNINSNFDKILISKKDIIVPYRNQIKFWANNNYLFNLFNSWEEIINV